MRTLRLLLLLVPHLLDSHAVHSFQVLECSKCIIYTKLTSFGSELGNLLDIPPKHSFIPNFFDTCSAIYFLWIEIYSGRDYEVIRTFYHLRVFEEAFGLGDKSAGHFVFVLF